MRDSTPQKGPTSSSQEDLPQGSANIAVALRHAISSGHYKFGEKLPTERELAERFRTSRGTIREALRQLEGLKMVRRRRGSGTFVTFLSEDAGSEVVNMTSPIELIDVRAALEPRMAHLAAINASNNDIERIRGALAQLEACGNDPVEFSRADETFHRFIAECTRNTLLMWFYRRINEIRGHTKWHGMRDKILDPARIAKYNQQHRMLFEAIRNRDAASAERVVTEHIADAKRHLLGAADH
jgi:DNA-binding FadR family transcriptional regulator